MLLAVLLVLFVFAAAKLLAGIFTRQSEGIIIMSIVVSFVGLMGLGFLIDDPVQATPDKHELLLLNDNSAQQSQGSASGIFPFYVSSSKSGEEFKYTFYHRSPEGEISLENIDVDRATVYEDAGTETPYVMLNWHCRAGETDVSAFSFRSCAGEDDYTFELHIPENTIEQKWVLDAK